VRSSPTRRSSTPRPPRVLLVPNPSWGQNVGYAGNRPDHHNLPFSQAYEPGSVFKVVTFSAALQKDGLITPTTVFSVPNSWSWGRPFHDAENHGLEHLTATQVLAQSSNIGTYEIAARVGESGILAQVQRFGFWPNHVDQLSDETQASW